MNDRELEYFFTREEGKTIVDFFELLVSKWNEWDYYVFICRSSYWLFLIFCAFRGWKIDKSKILSDRYVIKEYDTRLVDANIALIDDTMMSGFALYRVFSKLRQWYPKLHMECMIIYCGIYKIDPQKISRNWEEEKELISEFSSSIKYFLRANDETMGAFSFYATKLVQYAMVPYVVELPFLVNRKYTDCYYLDDLGKNKDLERIITVAEDTFVQLTSTDSNWHYKDNSYLFPNGEEIKCGYFYYSGAELRGIFGDYLLRSVVKCRYEYYDENNVRMIFTPFAIFQCIDYEEAKNIALTLYRETPYENFLQTAQDMIGSDHSQTDEKFEVAVYRSIVYFVSEYIAKIFSDYVSEIGISIGQNKSLLENHVSAEFINTVNDMALWEQEEFLKRLFRIRPVRHPVNQKQFNKNCIYQYEDKLNQTYRELYNEIIRRKRKTQTIFSFTIEEMTEYLYANIEFPSIETLKDCLIGSLLRMLDQSILGNVLELNGRVISRGFRYGENSDVLIPFYNPYVFFALDLYYMQIMEKAEDKEENRSKILIFLERLNSFFERRNYFDIIVEQEDFNRIRNYFHVSWSVMERNIVNKRFLLKEQNLNSVVCGEIYKFVQDM